jgi:hypothetical protein
MAAGSGRGPGTLNKPRRGNSVALAGLHTAIIGMLAAGLLPRYKYLG